MVGKPDHVLRSGKVVPQDRLKNVRAWPPRVYAAVALVCALAALAFWFPLQLWQATAFVGTSLVDVSPFVVPGVLLAAWVSASGAGDRISDKVGGHPLRAVLVASFVGALTPVCGVTVLPLMVGLLRAGVPLAPVMAFWLSSPVTDPAMLAATAALLGAGFAVGKTVAAFGLGLLGGVATVVLSDRPWVVRPLRDNRIVRGISGEACEGSSGFNAAVWKSDERKARFSREAWSTTRLMLICLIPAFAAEYALGQVLHPESLTAYVGADVWWAVPAAVFVGAPAYLDGFAALPLTRGLMDHGMSAGAAMAFLVSGGVVSIWGAMAIFPVLRSKPFALYVSLALAGSLASGWLFELVA